MDRQISQEHRGAKPSYRAGGITLRQLLNILVVQWRAVLVFALACGIAAYGLEFSRSASEAIHEVALTDQDARKVGSIASNIDELNSIQEYLDESPAMHLNPYDVQTLTLRFVVSDSDSYRANLLAQMYKSHIKSSAVTDILAADFPDENPEYLSDLLVTPDAATTVVSLDASTGYVDVSVALGEGVNADRVRSDLYGALSSYADELRAQGYSHAFTLVDSDISTMPRQDLQEKKTKCQADLASLTSTIDNDLSTITDAQKLALLEKCKDQSIELDSPVTKTLTEDMGTSSASPNKNWLILGFLLGAAFYAVCVLMYYSFSGRLFFPQELEDSYGLRVLGEFRSFEPHGILDRIFFSRHTYDALNHEHLDTANEAERAAARIVRTMNLRGIDSLDMVAPATLSGKASSALNQVIEHVQTHDKTLAILTDGAFSLDETRNSCCLLAVEAKRTKHSQVEARLTDASDFGITILGAIYLQVA